MKWYTQFATGLLVLQTTLSAEAPSTQYEIVEEKALLPILTPSLSQRQTLKMRLANGLEVFLISDPATEQSAAALSVRAGSWNDPEE